MEPGNENGSTVECEGEWFQDGSKNGIAILIRQGVVVGGLKHEILSNSIDRDTKKEVLNEKLGDFKDFRRGAYMIDAYKGALLTSLDSLKVLAYRKATPKEFTFSNPLAPRDVYQNTRIIRCLNGDKKVVFLLKPCAAIGALGRPVPPFTPSTDLYYIIKNRRYEQGSITVIVYTKGNMSYITNPIAVSGLKAYTNFSYYFEDGIVFPNFSNLITDELNHNFRYGVGRGFILEDGDTPKIRCIPSCPTLYDYISKPYLSEDGQQSFLNPLSITYGGNINDMFKEHTDALTLDSYMSSAYGPLGLFFNLSNILNGSIYSRLYFENEFSYSSEEDLWLKISERDYYNNDMIYDEVVHDFIPLSRPPFPTELDEDHIDIVSFASDEDAQKFVDDVVLNFS